jgi:dihydrodipicolinate synthase/N-acetylneuraminate lyase
MAEIAVERDIRAHLAVDFEIYAALMQDADRFLLDNGSDGLNVLGTTGEATSFALDQRKAAMSA